MVLKEYDNKLTFLNYLEQRINDSINRYFGFHTCDDDDASSDTDLDTGFISE